MAKNQTNGKQEELVLLHTHEEEANALINKIEKDVISSIHYLGSVYESLEIGKMAIDDFNDLIDNLGIETMKRFREKVQKDIATIPGNKLKEITSMAFEEELQTVIDTANKLNQDHSKYFKYVSFHEGEFMVSDSIKEEIYESHREYESKLASELRKKHQAALEEVNKFFLFLKKIKPDYLIFNASLIASFDASPDELQKTQPFQLREVNYQVIAENAQSFEENRINRLISDFVFKLEKEYRSEGTGKVSSLIQEMKKGSPEESAIADSEEVEDFIKEMNEMEVQKQLPKTPKRTYANPNL